MGYWEANGEEVSGWPDSGGKGAEARTRLKPSFRLQDEKNLSNLFFFLSIPCVNRIAFMSWQRLSNLKCEGECRGASSSGLTWGGVSSSGGCLLSDGAECHCRGIVSDR